MGILMQGLVLLVSGMGIVFLVLSLLVVVMNCSARVVQRFNYILPDDEPKKRKPVRQSSVAGCESRDDEIAVAIAAVVDRVR